MRGLVLCRRQDARSGHAADSTEALAWVQPKHGMIGWVRKRLELALDLVPPARKVRRNQRRLLLIRNLLRSESLSPPTGTKLARPGRAQVADPVSLTPRRDEVALASVLQDVDRHRSPAAAA